MHVRAEGGELLTAVLPPGQRHEVIAFERWLEQGAVKRRGPGGRRVRPTE